MDLTALLAAHPVIDGHNDLLWTARELFMAGAQEALIAAFREAAAAPPLPFHVGYRKNEAAELLKEAR